MQICDGTVALFLDGRVTLLLLPGLLWCNWRGFDVLQGALERGWLVLSSPILSGLFSLLPFPFSSLSGTLPGGSKSQGCCTDGGKDPRCASQEGVSISQRNLNAPARLLFWGKGGRAQSACKCACWRGGNQTVAFSRANFLQEQGEGSGASDWCFPS